MKRPWDAAFARYRRFKAGFPDFVSKKTLSIRDVRRAQFRVLLEAADNVFDDEFFKTIASEKKSKTGRFGGLQPLILR
jgi:hypothetical protein